MAGESCIVEEGERRGGGRLAKQGPGFGHTSRAVRGPPCQSGIGRAKAPPSPRRGGSRADAVDDADDAWRGPPRAPASPLFLEPLSPGTPPPPSVCQRARSESTKRPEARRGEGGGNLPRRRPIRTSTNPPPPSLPPPFIPLGGTRPWRMRLCGHIGQEPGSSSPPIFSRPPRARRPRGCVADRSPAAVTRARP